MSPESNARARAVDRDRKGELDVPGFLVREASIGGDPERAGRTSAGQPGNGHAERRRVAGNRALGVQNLDGRKVELDLVDIVERDQREPVRRDRVLQKRGRRTIGGGRPR